MSSIFLKRLFYVVWTLSPVKSESPIISTLLPPVSASQAPLQTFPPPMHLHADAA